MTTFTEIPPLILKKGQERRLRNGHCWVFSNEVNTGRTPLTAFQPGDAVRVVDHNELFIGHAYVNPHSLISARLVSRDPLRPLSATLIARRLRTALRLREQLYAHPCYRLAFGESDGLPGLILDRYGDYLSLQLTTAGMERQRETLLGVLDEVLKPKGVVLRNDTSIRALEGLPQTVETLGSVPDLVTLQEGESQFQVSLAQGQKTGWFYDQAASRTRLLPYVRDKRVLDLFSYVGGWGVRCAQAGAGAVTCVDASAPALEGVQRNAQLNKVNDRVRILKGEVFQVLKDLREGGERFDIVLVDPPAFIKRRKDQRQGELAYRRVNQAAMQLLENEGMLVSSSCSSHLSGESLLRLINQGARPLQFNLQLLESGAQGPDHPIHPAIPETAYLKTFFLRLLANF